jgi:hypothetical protein
MKEKDVFTHVTGDRVSQAQYGDGTFMSVNAHHTVIEFDEHGLRTFSTPLVRLEKAFTTAPVKVVKPRRRVAKRTSAVASGSPT